MKISTKYAIALTAAMGLLPVVIDTTIVSVALVPIMAAMHTDFNTVQWIVTEPLGADVPAVVPVKVSQIRACWCPPFGLTTTLPTRTV